MFAYVEKILNFGFLGLSFLMLYLAYDLVKKTLGTNQDVHENTGSLIKTFMKIALVFMVLAGPLQWATIGIKHWVEDKRVNLHVGLSTTEWKDTFGHIYIRKDGDYHPITVETVSKEFKEGEEVLINVENVMSAIALMRKQIEVLNSKVLKPVESERDTLEEG